MDLFVWVRLVLLFGVLLLCLCLFWVRFLWCGCDVSLCLIWLCRLSIECVLSCICGCRCCWCFFMIGGGWDSCLVV